MVKSETVTLSKVQITAMHSGDNHGQGGMCYPSVSMVTYEKMSLLEAWDRFSKLNMHGLYKVTFEPED